MSAAETPKPGNAPRPYRPPDEGVQRRWLDGAQGRSIRCRMLDGKVLVGCLGEHDRFTFELFRKDREGVTLVHKHGVCYVEIDSGAGDGER